MVHHKRPRVDQIRLRREHPGAGQTATGKVARRLMGHPPARSASRAQAEPSGAHRRDPATQRARADGIDEPSRNTRAQGMPGAGRPHGPPAKKMQAAGTTGSAETSRHSPRDGLHDYIVLSPVYGSLATVALGIIARKLGASVAAPGPHDFTSASCRSSACKHAAADKRPSPPRLTCRDDRDTPLVAKQDGRSRAHFLEKRKRFLERRSDRRSSMTRLALADGL